MNKHEIKVSFFIVFFFDGFASSKKEARKLAAQVPQISTHRLAAHLCFSQPCPRPCSVAQRRRGETPILVVVEPGRAVGIHPLLDLPISLRDRRGGRDDAGGDGRGLHQVLGEISSGNHKDDNKARP